MGAITKTCTKCKKEMDLDCFYNSKTNKDGKDGTCKKCKQETATKWNKKNQARRRVICLKSQNKNIEKHRLSGRMYYNNNKLKYKEWVKNNSDKKRQIANKYSRKNISSLQNPYIVSKLLARGFKRDQITSELIEVQRLLIKTIRLCRT